ncbi:hypothetical protein ACJMK2_032544 [Sinanodonta woodiana]|uniref:Uncharacterized protein n=1 Tax=Sinanodonta woodiana TaxID=1069815 RepID=A0ABD3X212_SINWO
MISIALRLITFSCTWSSVFPLYIRPDVVLLQGINEFGSEVSSSGDWLTFNPYQRYLSTKHRSKRENDWGFNAKVNIPFGDRFSKPNFEVGTFFARKNPTLNSRLEAAVSGKFGETPRVLLRGHLDKTDNNNHVRVTGQMGGRVGDNTDWSLGGVLSHSEGDWTGRFGGGLNSQGGSTLGFGFERGGRGGHIDVTNGRVVVGTGSFPNTDPPEG